MGEMRVRITGHAKEKAFCRWGDMSVTVMREAKARSLTTEEKHLEYLIFSIILSRRASPVFTGRW